MQRFGTQTKGRPKSWTGPVCLVPLNPFLRVALNPFLRVLPRGVGAWLRRSLGLEPSPYCVSGWGGEEAPAIQSGVARAS